MRMKIKQLIQELVIVKNKISKERKAKKETVQYLPQIIIRSEKVLIKIILIKQIMKKVKMKMKKM